MKGITIFETLTDIREDYILDAGLDACFLEAPVRKRERGPSAFSRFMNSGWGVAIVCALVAVSVMGGIIWAGFNVGEVPPGYNDAITGEVYLTAGSQSVEPEAFFGYSEVHKGNQSAMSCGAGFYGEFTVSPVPTMTYADDLRLHMPKNYTLEAVYVYDPDAPTEAIYTFESVDDLKTLTAGSYYVALRITHTEGKNEYGYDYAFCLNVNIDETETPIALDLSFCEFALGHRLHVKFHPDGHLWILIGQLDAIHEIYKGTYVLGEGQITIDCPMDTNYFGFSLHGTHAFEASEESVRIGDLTVPTKDNDSTCPAVFVPLIMAYFDAYNASVPEYRQDQPEGYAVMDMDGDGTKEVVVKLAWDQKTAYDRSVVFFIDYDAEKILEHTEISYDHLYVDGSFGYTFDRTEPSYGVDKLVATETGHVAQTLWRICNDGSENAEYYIGDRKVTKEELDAYTAEIECEEVTWNDCTWEITELETDFYEETEPDGKA